MINQQDLKNVLDLVIAKKWDDAVSLLKSLESGTEWSDDAPPSELIIEDAEILSAINACYEARLIPGDAYFTKLAILKIKSLLGSDEAHAEAQQLINNEAVIASVEMDLEINDESDNASP